MSYSPQIRYLAFVLLFVSTDTIAQWVEVGHNETTTFYANLASIQIDDTGIVKMSNLLDLKAPDNSTAPPYLSMKSLAEYNCKEVTYRFLESQNFSDNMGNGDVVLRNTVGDWNPLPSRSAVKALWNIACGQTQF
jgi:hypothetical protein